MYNFNLIQIFNAFHPLFIVIVSQSVRMYSQNSFISNKKNCSLSVTFVQDQIQYIYFEVNYSHSPQKYELQVKETDIIAYFGDVFEGCKGFYSYLLQIKDQEHILLVQEDGKIVIRIAKTQNKIVILQALRGCKTQSVCGSPNLPKNEGTVSASQQQQEQLQQIQNHLQNPNQISSPIEQKDDKKLQRFASVMQAIQKQASSFITGQESQEDISKFSPSQMLCYRAIIQFRYGSTIRQVSDQLRVSLTAVKKMNLQLSCFGKIFLPKGPKPQDQMQYYDNNDFNNFHPYAPFNSAEQQPEFIQLNSIQKPQPRRQAQKSQKVQANDGDNNDDDNNFSGGKMPNQTVIKIKQILLRVVKEGRMQSYEQMQQYLATQKIVRSLSSIYRYVHKIKNTHKQFQFRNYAMHKKDVYNNQNLTQLPINYSKSQ